MVSFRRRNNFRCPWMTPELLHLMHKEKSLFRKIRRSSIPNGNLIRQHRRLRSSTTNQYTRLRNRYCRQHLNEYRNAPRLLWSAVNHVTGRHSQRLPPSAELSVATLTDHFKNLFNHPGPTCVLPYGPNRKEYFLRLTSVSVAEVERVFSRLVPTKVPGPDTIRPSELKLVTRVIAPTVTILFNKEVTCNQ